MAMMYIWQSSHVHVPVIAKYIVLALAKVENLMSHATKGLCSLRDGQKEFPCLGMCDVICNMLAMCIKMVTWHVV